MSYRLPGSVTGLGNYVFYNCKALNSVTIPTSVTDLGSKIFIGTGWYNSLPDGPVYFNNMLYVFKTSGEEASVDIRQGTVAICGGAFYGCHSLTSVTIPSSVHTIGTRAFYGCRSLTSVTIPSSVRTIGTGAFYGCKNLKSVKLPTFITEIGHSVFYECSKLQTIEIPASVKSIGGRAFAGCTSLKSVEFPSSVSSIGSGAFLGCTGLKSVVIPASVRSIESGAFSGCTGHVVVHIYWDDPSSVSVSSDFLSDVDMATCVLYVPRGKLLQYLITPIWKGFSKVIEYDSADNELTLDVRYGNIAVIKQRVFRGTRVEWEVPDGYSRLRFNGEDVSGQLKDGTYVTPPLTENSTLQVDLDSLYDNNGDGKVDSQDVLNVYEYMEGQ